MKGRRPTKNVSLSRLLLLATGAQPQRHLEAHVELLLKFLPTINGNKEAEPVSGHVCTRASPLVLPAHAVQQE